MDQFDKNIQKKLSRGPDRKPDPEVWRQVVEGLGNRGSEGGVKSWWRWLSTGALILLLCSIAYYLGQRNSYDESRFRQQLEQMSQAIAQLKATIRDTIYLRDTFWQLSTIAHLPATSQILESSTSRSAKGQRHEDQTKWTSDFLKNHPFNTRSPFTAIGLTPWTRTPSYSWKMPSSKPSYQSERSSFENMTMPGEPGSSIQHIPIKSILPQYHFKRVISLHPYRGLYAEDIIKMGRRRKIWDVILPDRHRIALIGGALNAATDELEHPGEWLLSLQYEMLFSSRISLLTGVRYRNFSAESQHELEDMDYPIPTDLRPGDQLEEIYISNYYLSIPLMAKYSIPIGKNFQPYLRSGLLFTKVLAQNYKFEINRQGDELKLDSKIGKSAMILNSYLMGVGIEYRLSPRFSSSFDLEGRYQFRQTNTEFLKNHGFGIRLGLHYTL